MRSLFTGRLPRGSGRVGATRGDRGSPSARGPRSPGRRRRRTGRPGAPEWNSRTHDNSPVRTRHLDRTVARYAALAGGVAAVSFSAIFIRLAHAPALAMAFWRNVIATALLAPVALLRHRAQFRAMSRGEVLVAGSAGVLLAGHFATWIPSLRYTTVAASTVLVTAAPVLTAMAARWTGERVSGRTWAGIAVALAGAMVVSGGFCGYGRQGPRTVGNQNPVKPPTYGSNGA